MLCRRQSVLCPNHHALAHRLGRRLRGGIWDGPLSRAAMFAAMERYENPQARVAHMRELVETLRPVKGSA